MSLLGDSGVVDRCDFLVGELHVLQMFCFYSVHHQGSSDMSLYSSYGFIYIISLSLSLSLSLSQTPPFRQFSSADHSRTYENRASQHSRALSKLGPVKRPG